MTWRELLALRPQWWIDLTAGPRTSDSDAEPRPLNDRARFWEEFRAGQREADLRAVAGRKIPPEDTPE